MQWCSKVELDRRSAQFARMIHMLDPALLATKDKKENYPLEAAAHLTHPHPHPPTPQISCEIEVHDGVCIQTHTLIDCLLLSCSLASLM